MSGRPPRVALDPNGALRTLVLQEAGVADVVLTVRGAAPDRLRYLGRTWAATRARLHRPMAADGYAYRIAGTPVERRSPEWTDRAPDQSEEARTNRESGRGASSVPTKKPSPSLVA